MNKFDLSPQHQSIDTVPLDQRKQWMVEQALRWAYHREWARTNKVLGRPLPWTEDTIIQNSRFCNVDRQDDKETMAFNELFEANRDKPDLWFNIGVARWINWSSTVKQIGYTDITQGYDPAHMFARMEAVQGDKFFTGSYLIKGRASLADVDGDESVYERAADKRYFLAHFFFRKLAQVGAPAPGETLESYHQRLMQVSGNGDFMAGQIIADLKYYTMRDAPDWGTWAPIGPGPVRFLNLYNGRDSEVSTTKKFHVEMAEFCAHFNSFLGEVMLQGVGNADILRKVAKALADPHNLKSNLLCETFKYVKAMGGGRLRNKYPGSAEVVRKATGKSTSKGLKAFLK